MTGVTGYDQIPMLGHTVYAKLVEAAYSVSLMGDEAGFGRGALLR